VHGPDVIGMDEHPAQALRERKGASILVATNLVREGLADGAHCHNARRHIRRC
jgi:glycerol-3-phosphate acyltransferase PlsX